jgi:hypothetical protein
MLANEHLFARQNGTDFRVELWFDDKVLQDALGGAADAAKEGGNLLKPKEDTSPPKEIQTLRRHGCDRS